MLQCIKDFFRTMWSSVTGSVWYQSVPESRTSSAVKYFLGFMFIVAVGVAVMPMAFGLGFLYFSHGAAEQLHEQIRGIYPDELVIRVEDGRIQTNVTEPYAIAMPAVWRDRLQDEEGQRIDNILVIDTAHPLTTEAFRQQRTLFILGERSIGFYDQQKRKLEAHDMDDLGADRVILDQSMYSDLIRIAWKWLTIGGTIFFVTLPILLWILFSLWYAFYLVFGALVIWLAFYITHRPYGYGQAYKTGLYLLTLPIVLSFLVPWILAIPLSFTLIVFGLAWYHFRAQPVILAPAETEAASSEAPPTTL